MRSLFESGCYSKEAVNGASTVAFYYHKWKMKRQTFLDFKLWKIFHISKSEKLVYFLCVRKTLSCITEATSVNFRTKHMFHDQDLNSRPWGLPRQSFNQVRDLTFHYKIFSLKSFKNRDSITIALKGYIEPVNFFRRYHKRSLVGFAAFDKSTKYF